MYYLLAINYLKQIINRNFIRLGFKQNYSTQPCINPIAVICPSTKK